MGRRGSEASADRAGVLDARLSLFTGKGGVGKSTVVAALALEAARQGRRPLVVELGHRASMQAIFGVDLVAHAPTEVRPGVWASNIDLEQALADYLGEHVPVPALARRIAKNPSLRRFFEAAPAVGEVLTLQHLEQLLTEAWDPILVDFDSTGHARMFLELPRVFEGLVPEGPVRRLLDGFTRLLAASKHTRLHLVALPSPLPVTETVELHQRLRAEHALTLGAIFVNQVPDDPLPPGGGPALEGLLARLDADSPAAADLRRLADAALARQRALKEIARLEALGERCVRLPRVAGPIDDTALGRLGLLAGAA